MGEFLFISEEKLMKMKRTLSMALALCLMFGSAASLPEGTFTQSTSITASAEVVRSGKCGENVKWSFDSDGVLTISGTGAMKDYDNFEISYGGSPFQGFSAGSFGEDIESVDIKNGVTSIGSYAFIQSALSSVNIPKSVNTIRHFAFWGCNSLNSINIPDTISSIEYCAFKGCDNLTSVTISDGVTSIDREAFYNCPNVKSITIPKSVTEIGDYAFGFVAADFDHVKVDDFKISCYKGTAGEKYAIDNEFDYELLDVEHVEAKAATCTEEGNIEYWTWNGKFFSDEKATKEITKEETVVAKTEHTFGEWEQTVAPTCTQKGSESRKCSVCGEEETREIDALGHKFEDSWTVTKEATCTQAGSEERICTVCGGNEEGGKETREIKAKGHKFGKEWTVVRTASAGMPSLKVKYCENCKGEEEGGKLEKEGSSVLEKERVFGDNRFKTSLAIADQFKNANNGKAFENIIVASGADFADALSASYLAKVKNAPILLVANKATVVINETIEYIKKNAAAGANVYLVGGSSVVPNSMITDLKKLGFKAKRLAGSNRYDTNIEVLKEAGVTNEKILIASGMDYADALSASAVGLPILLVAGKGKSLTPNQKAYLQSLKDVKVEKGAAPLSKAYIIGGTGAVSAGILKQAKEIFAAAYRVAGSNRYETSVKVAETFFKKETPKTVAVAYGMNYPDGLCGGPLAIAYKCPLILTVNQKPDAAVAYAKSIKAASVVAFGGKQLISVETMNKILGK